MIPGKPGASGKKGTVSDSVNLGQMPQSKKQGNKFTKPFGFGKRMKKGAM